VEDGFARPITCNSEGGKPMEMLLMTALFISALLTFAAVAAGFRA
jgi:hypothetical protein